MFVLLKRKDNSKKIAPEGANIKSVANYCLSLYIILLSIKYTIVYNKNGINIINNIKLTKLYL